MSGDYRHDERASLRRALTVLAAVAGVLAVGVAVMAFTTFSPASGVVLETEPAALSGFSSAAPTSGASPSSTTPTTAPAESTLPSTTVAPTTTEPPTEVPPVGVTIDAFNLVGTVRPVGLEDSGEMEVPDVKEVGWYDRGAAPGHPGATVLVAHVWWGDTAGPFHRLGDLELGAPIELQLEDGRVLDYTVVERAMYDKDALPGDLWRRSGPETLVLITCGGDFDTDSRRYEQNIVAYALPTDLASSGDAASTS